MPRGRPKGSKNKSTLMKMNLLADSTPVVKAEESTPEPVVEIKKEPVIKNSFKCDVCERIFPGSPCMLDFVRITGKADYHRESRSKKLYVCNECSKELSDVVDKWLLKKNPSLRKFPIGDVSDEEE